MDKCRKKDILQMVKTMMHANDSIRKAEFENSSSVINILCQCQESAIQIGTYLENSDGSYAVLVTALEDYCENIYQMRISIPDRNQCLKLYEKIREQLIEVYNAITNNMPEDKKEVVFLPYKASMWDSLESVWKAADADQDIDAYVIPIPYYDKNPDGSFREEHYEGNLYPKYVPITRYDEYDFEVNRPEMIFIHMPYDAANYVTSVHPFFYAENLRRYTEKLIYIPYFVLGEIEPGDQATIDRMKHFCFLPGVIYADKVIVQSEKMRQIYIDEYIKAAQEAGLSGKHTDRKCLEKKILGLGSPKDDKILNTKKEEVEIPREWLRFIQKSDGSFKKIILYNTGISALLQYNDQMIRKMQNVFEIFRGNREEIALLWRPHPLIQSTLSSMRPTLWEEYQRLLKWYRDNEMGIYDDTSDLNRAIAISDAYYGDYSSVAWLCHKRGIPVMYENADIIN